MNLFFRSFGTHKLEMAITRLKPSASSSASLQEALRGVSFLAFSNFSLYCLIMALSTIPVSASVDYLLLALLLSPHFCALPPLIKITMITVGPQDDQKTNSFRNP